MELFIRQFTDVAEANNWCAMATLLHLRKALEKEANECSRGRDVRDIFTSLRARYGMTAREARAKLAGLRRDHKTTLQEHSAEVEKLVGVAYAAFPGELRRTMSMDTFASTIGNGYLLRHLLAVPAETLEDAVRAGNEYLQIQTAKPFSYRNSANIVDDGEEEQEEPK